MGFQSPIKQFSTAFIIVAAMAWTPKARCAAADASQLRAFTMCDAGRYLKVSENGEYTIGKMGSEIQVTNLPLAEGGSVIHSALFTHETLICGERSSVSCFDTVDVPKQLWRTRIFEAVYLNEDSETPQQALGTAEKIVALCDFPQTDLLICAGSQGSLAALSRMNGVIAWEKRFVLDARIRDLKVLPRRKLVAVCGDDPDLTLVNAQNGLISHKIKASHKWRCGYSALFITTTEDVVAVGGDCEFFGDLAVHRWNFVNDWQESQIMTLEGLGFAVSSSSDRVAVLVHGEGIILFDPEGWTNDTLPDIVEIPMPQLEYGDIASFSPNGQWIGIARMDGSVSLFQVPVRSK